MSEEIELNWSFVRREFGVALRAYFAPLFWLAKLFRHAGPRPCRPKP